MRFEFTDEEIEAQRGEVTWPRSHRAGLPTLRPAFFLSRVLISSTMTFRSHCSGHIVIQRSCAPVQISLKI